MNTDRFKYVYGPVPSRRLGRSLGVDLVPFKTCTYDCVYCQLGRTTNLTVDRREYVAIGEILEEIKKKLSFGDSPDYISLAGSGDPTLNSGIGNLICEIKKISNIPVAVLTNGSLLWRKDVREELMEADLLIPSLDAGDEDLFQYVNRPHREISFKQMVDGLAEFTKGFSGEVWLEILLLESVTGKVSEVEKLASLVKYIGPERVQLNTVYRPPAEGFARPVAEEALSSFRKFFPGRVDIVGEFRGSRKTSFTAKDAREEDILALLGRRPCTLVDIGEGLGIHVTEAVKFVDKLVEDGRIKILTSGGRNFYTSTSDLLLEERNVR